MDEEEKSVESVKNSSVAIERENYLAKSKLIAIERVGSRCWLSREQVNGKSAILNFVSPAAGGGWLVLSF